uniref:Uncharacterized protein n=1 Tax=Oryza rufipogon TaxID=4529 RepID=A0A0E0MY90_ORYRU
MQQLRLRLNTKAQHRRGKTHRSKLGTKIGPHSHRAHEALARHKSPDFRRTGPPSRTNTSPQPPKDSTARSGRRPTEGRSITEGRRPGRPEEELRVGVRGTQDLGVNHVSGEELLVSRDKTSRLWQPPPRYHQRRERGALGRAAEQLDNWQQRSTGSSDGERKGGRKPPLLLRFAGLRPPEPAAAASTDSAHAPLREPSPPTRRSSLLHRRKSEGLPDPATATPDLPPPSRETSPPPLTGRGDNLKLKTSHGLKIKIKIKEVASTLYMTT